jgi:Zn finger protein HypA/HybF involved in hydrogenase expression
MVVRVISIKPIKEEKKRWTCGHCGAKLEYTDKDVKSWNCNISSPAGLDGAEYIICPNCHKHVNLRVW